MSIRIGIDLGGTKIESIALGADGSVLARHRVPTPQGDYAATVATVARLVEELERELGARGRVGIGIPGAESRATGLIKNANSTCLIGKPLRQELQAALGRPVRLANDANCFALSEAIDGAAAGEGVVFGIILGTGVGAGIVVHGRVLEGANHIAGEWGHNPLPDIQAVDLPLPLCYCGRAGCNETYLSGPGLAADHFKATQQRRTPEEIADGARSGAQECRDTLDRYLERLAKATAVVINILDPDAIVLGGGLSNLDILYRELPARWKKTVFSDEVRTRLLPNQFGDSSGVRGAAWLWDSADDVSAGQLCAQIHRCQN